MNDLNKELQTFLDSKRKELLPDFEGSPTELLDEILNLEKARQEAIFKQVKRFKEVELPWKGFPEDAAQKIDEVIVSQKPKDKLLIQENKDNGDLQIKIRGQLHEGTLYGKSQGVEAYRIPLSKFAGKQFATEKTIEKIANPYLREAIRGHLIKYGGKKEDAFSAEGILNLNNKLADKRNSHGEPAPHTPISSIKVFYRDPAKLRLKKGQEEPQEALQRLDRSTAYNDSLFVKTGDNYLFAVLEKEGKRIFDLITFFDAANLLKEAFNKAADKKTFNKEQIFKRHFEEANKARLLFTLKQGDAIYLPADGEELIEDSASVLYNEFWNDKAARGGNIYYVTKYSGNEIYFIGHKIADSIIRKKEFGTQDAFQNIEGQSIKANCIKLLIDRLGNVQPA